MFTTAFWKATAERAVKTFAQSLVALLGSNAVDIFKTSFAETVYAALIATGLSVLSSLASGKFGNSGPSLSTESIAE